MLIGNNETGADVSGKLSGKLCLALVNKVVPSPSTDKSKLRIVRFIRSKRLKLDLRFLLFLHNLQVYGLQGIFVCS